MPAPILTLTLNPAIDLHLAIEDWNAGKVLRALTARRSAGGKGLNVARVLMRLGLTVEAAVVLGGPDAAVYRSLLDEESLSVTTLPIGGPVRTNLTLAAPDSARRIKVNQPGPRITSTEWAGLETRMSTLFAGRDWIVLAGGLPPGAPRTAYARLVRLAHRAGARVALDCEGTPLRAALAAHPDLIKPNHEELALTLGLSRPIGRKRSDVLTAAMRLQAAGARHIAVTHGAGEALWLEERGRAAWRGRPPAVKALGTLGCGDATLAGIVAALHRQQSIEAAFALGLACGAANALTPETEGPRPADIRRLVRASQPVALPPAMLRKANPSMEAKPVQPNRRKP